MVPLNIKTVLVHGVNPAAEKSLHVLVRIVNCNGEDTYTFRPNRIWWKIRCG